MLTSVVYAQCAVNERGFGAGFVTVAVWAPLTEPPADGTYQMPRYRIARNLVTEVGDQVILERAAGLGIAGPVSGMRLGSGTTPASKTGSGAAIDAYIPGTARELYSAPISTLEGSTRRVTYSAQWPAGTFTHGAVTEAVLTNAASITDSAGSAGDTIARVVFDPIEVTDVNLVVVTWAHDLEFT